MVLEYLNQNSLRNYPVLDGLSRLSNDSLFTLPNTLIVDLSLSASGTVGSIFYISSVTANTGFLSVQISIEGQGVFGTFSTALPTNQTNFDLQLQASSLFPDAQGVLTIGSVDELAQQPSGTFNFNVTATRLISSCATVGNSGVYRINFVDTNGLTSTLTGNVTLVANSNIQFAPNGSYVYINAGENLGLNKQCASTPKPITTINGVPPDNTGNFNLVADPSSCISIGPIQYGVLISDSCGKPCLGSTEIAALATRVNTLENDIYSLRDFSNNLQNLIAQANTLLGYQYQCST